MPSCIMLNFDLSQEALKECYKGSSANAYSEIKTFLIREYQDFLYPCFGSHN